MEEEEIALLDLLCSFKNSKLKATYSDDRLQAMKQDLQNKAVVSSDS